VDNRRNGIKEGQVRLARDLPNGFATTGLISEEIFQICALLRVGAPNYPALIHGVIEGVTIQTYQD
jgi:hypothetical protein